MIEYVSGDISLVFEEKSGTIRSLKHQNYEYVSSPVPVLEACMMDRAGSG